MEQESSTEDMHVDRVVIKPPPFWKADPNLWFLQLEAQFQINNITSDLKKYNYVISSIDTEILSQVTDYIHSPPESQKYEGIKKKLIAIFSDSKEKQLRKLLSEMELGDRKPSQLLNEMRRLGSSSVSSDLLKTLWMQRLPVHIQSVLTTSSDNLESLSIMADKIAEIEQPRTFAITSDPKPGNLEEVISKLSREVSELKVAFKEDPIPRSKQRSRFRSRTPSRNRLSNSTSNELCWYHQEFKSKARKCVAPCKYFGIYYNEPENGTPCQ